MPSRKLPPDADLIEMYSGGMSAGEIAEVLNSKQVTVDSALRRAGVTLRTVKEAAALRVARGRSNPTSYWLGKKQTSEHVESRVSKIRGENHYMWRGGLERRPYRDVVEKDICECCGGSDRLAIHHRNLDHYDNVPDNLGVLCVHCHSSVHKQMYWDAIHAGEKPAKSNAPIHWGTGHAK